MKLEAYLESHSGFSMESVLTRDQLKTWDNSELLLVARRVRSRREELGEVIATRLPHLKKDKTLGYCKNRDLSNYTVVSGGLLIS